MQFGPKQDGLVVGLKSPTSIHSVNVRKQRFEVHIRNVSEVTISCLQAPYWTRLSLKDRSGHELQDLMDYGYDAKWVAISQRDVLTLRPGQEKVVGVYLVSLRKLPPHGDYSLQAMMINPPHSASLLGRWLRHRAFTTHLWRGSKLFSLPLTIAID